MAASWSSAWTSWEEILRTHSEILQSSMLAHTSPGSSNHNAAQNHAAGSVRGSNASVPSEHGTPREPAAAPPMFARPGPDSLRTPPGRDGPLPAETVDDDGVRHGSAYPGHTSTPGMHDGFQPMSSISPQNQMQAAIPPSVAAQEYYGTGPGEPRRRCHRRPRICPGQSSDQDLLRTTVLYALVDLYFKHINTWCPILHRKTTLDSLFGPSMIEETDKILLHAIVATTLRYSTDARLTDERRAHYHAVSKQRVILYGMESSSVKSLQALVILALDLCGDSNGPPGWNIMALITRSVVQLGLAVETNSFSVSPSYTSIYTLRAMILPEPRDFIEEEARRRLFWMVYLLDRYATIATAFEFALDDKEIDRTLPCRDDLWIKNQKVETRWFRADEAAPRRPTAASPARSSTRSTSPRTWARSATISRSWAFCPRSISSSSSRSTSARCPTSRPGR